MLTIKAPETFAAKVTITDASGKGHEVEFTFKHKTLDELQAFLYGEHEGRTDAQALGEIVIGWSGVDAPFSPEALATLLQNYGGSAVTIATAYRDALTGARTKN